MIINLEIDLSGVQWLRLSLSLIKGIMLVVIIKNLLMSAYVAAIVTDTSNAKVRLPSYLLFPDNWFMSLCLDNSDFSYIPIGDIHIKIGYLCLAHFLGHRWRLGCLFNSSFCLFLNVQISLWLQKQETYWLL